MILLLCAIGYWLSQHLFVAYVQAVTQEERHVLRPRKPAQEPLAPAHHLGPKCFLVLDLLLVVGIIAGLWSLFAKHPVEHWFEGAMDALVLFSVLVTFWMIRSRRRLQVYYSRLAACVRSSSVASKVAELRNGRAKARAWQDAYTFGSAVCASLPLVLFLLGFDLAIWSSSPTMWLGMFAGCFVIPQVVLGILILREVLPVRRLVYDRRSNEHPC